VADRLPLVMNAGQPQQLQSGDRIPVTALRQVTQARLLGRATASTGDEEEILIGTGLSLDPASKTLSNTGSSASTSGLRTDRNYVTNPDAETATTGWATYNDAAAATPVDGTGGSPSITWTRSTTTPLRGTAHFLLTKGATNRQGDGVSYDFTLDNFDSVSRNGLYVEFDVAWLSGTYTNGDLLIFLYDVSNSLMKTPYGTTEASAQVVVQFPGSSYGHVRAWLPTAGTLGPNMRLVIHVATTSASAYTLAFDNFMVGPITPGEYVSDWVPFTPTIGAATTAPTKSASRTEMCWWRRVGMRLDISFNYSHTVAGTAGSGTYKFQLPCSFTADNTMQVVGVQGGGSATPTVVGHSAPNSTAGGTQGIGTVMLYDTTNLSLWRFNDTANAAVGSASNGMNNTTIGYSFQASVFLTGWA
jgi:hypothetical protein